jgi:hypothetical protein
LKNERNYIPPKVLDGYREQRNCKWSQSKRKISQYDERKSFPNDGLQKIVLSGT